MDLQNFPQPTRPLSFSKLTSFKYSAAITQSSEPIILQDYEPSASTFSRQQPHEDEVEVFGELTQILLECLETVDNKHKGLLLQKIFSELEKESQLETFIMEKLKHSQVKLISEFLDRYPASLQGQIGEEKVNYGKKVSVNRGFDDGLMEAHRTGQSSMEELSHKLERFKVKPVIIEGGTVIKK